MDKVLFHVNLMMRRRDYVDIGQPNVDTPNISTIVASDKDNRRCLIAIIEKTKVTIDVVKKILTLRDNITDIVVIYEKSLTPDAKHAIAVNKILTFQIFSFDEMSYDPISVVPKHYVVKEFYKEWHKFPIILSTDMIARYYNFKRGDVIAVEESEYVIMYRKCI